MITYEVAKQQGYTSTEDDPYLYLKEFINKPISEIPDIKKWAYDVECYPDFFSVTFIPGDTSKQLIKKYAKADISHNIHALIKTMRKMNVIIFTIRYNEPVTNLKQFIESKLLYRIGFNNIHYDDPLMALFTVIPLEAADLGAIRKPNIRVTPATWTITPLNKVLIDLSNEIIYNGLDRSDYKRLQLKGISLDVMKVNRLDKLGISLKKSAVAIKWYRLQDLPYIPNTMVANENGIANGKLFNILTYNINDVLITIGAFKASRKEFQMRAGISKSFNVSVHSLSRSASGDKILESKYSEISGRNRYTFMNKRTHRKAVAFVDIIDETIKFETPEFKSLHHELMRTTAYMSGHPKFVKFEKEIIFDNTKYKMALGGLHSVDRPMYIKSCSKYTYRDADVRSYYPNLMLNLFICPKHLDVNVFLSALEMMLNDRVFAKAEQYNESLSASDREKYKYINEGLKISINNIFGKLGYPDGWLYDLRAMYRTTINGQLKLLKLIEMLYLQGIHTVSANTDGIICKVPKGKEDEYYKVCAEWEKLNNLVLEYNDYDKYLGTSVNHYIAITKDGKIKRKGDFVFDIKLDKGYSAPIIPLALSNWFLKDKPIRDTVYGSRNIHNFVYSQKVGKVMELHVMYVNKDTGQVETQQLQNTDRYYVSKSGVALYKQYVQEHERHTGKDGNVRRTGLKKGEYVTIINDLMFNYKLDNINRTYYVREAQTILDKALRLDYKLITGTKSRKKSNGIGRTGIAGTLFDILDE